MSLRSIGGNVKRNREDVKGKGEYITDCGSGIADCNEAILKAWLFLRYSAIPIQQPAIEGTPTPVVSLRPKSYARRANLRYWASRSTVGKQDVNRGGYEYATRICGEP